jgi:hypothetical protein
MLDLNTSIVSASFIARCVFFFFFVAPDSEIVPNVQNRLNQTMTAARCDDGRNSLNNANATGAPPKHKPTRKRNTSNVQMSPANDEPTPINPLANAVTTKTGLLPTTSLRLPHTTVPIAIPTKSCERDCW